MRYEPHSDQISPGEVRTPVLRQFRSSNDRVGSLVGGIFLVVGLGLLAGGVWSGHAHYRILKDWPRVDATVTQAEVTKGVDKDGTMMYGASMEFRYSVQGKEYVTPSSSSYRTSSYTEMKRLVDTFAPGTQHTVLYHPADPSDIRWDAGFNFSFFLVAVILGGMGLVFTAVGGGVWYGFRSSATGFLCASCGRPVPDGSDFCPHCATPVSSR